MKSLHSALVLLAPLSLLPATPAQAGDGPSVTVAASSQDFSDGYGSLRSVTLEYKAVLDDDTTVLVSPVVGQRRTASMEESAVGGGATVYHDWSGTVSTRTQAFVAEDEPVFANLDLSQDVTVKVASQTTVTVGGRWARYFGGKEVTFLSVGARQYFKGGSVAYRLSRIDPEGGRAFLAHLLNLTLDDPHGAGKTRLWLGTGAASLERSQLEDSFTGHDWSGLVQRAQPLTGKLALIGSAGVSTYARPGDDITSTTIGLGLKLGLD